MFYPEVLLPRTQFFSGNSFATTNLLMKPYKTVDPHGVFDCVILLGKRFYDYYSTSEFMAQIDGIICTHASSLCELYMPFGKPMMIISSSRYDIGRFDRHNPSRLKEWNDI